MHLAMKALLMKNDGKREKPQLTENWRAAVALKINGNQASGMEGAAETSRDERTIEPGWFDDPRLGDPPPCPTLSKLLDEPPIGALIEKVRSSTMLVVDIVLMREAFVGLLSYEALLKRLVDPLSMSVA